MRILPLKNTKWSQKVKNNDDGSGDNVPLSKIGAENGIFLADFASRSALEKKRNWLMSEPIDVDRTLSGPDGSFSLPCLSLPMWEKRICEAMHLGASYQNPYQTMVDMERREDKNQMENWNRCLDVDVEQARIGNHDERDFGFISIYGFEWTRTILQSGFEEI